MEVKTVLIHINGSVHIFPEVAVHVERVVQKSCSLPEGSKSLKNACDGGHFLVTLHVEDRKHY